jgi:hypothetical protein
MAVAKFQGNNLKSKIEVAFGPASTALDKNIHIISWIRRNMITFNDALFERNSSRMTLQIVVTAQHA